MGKKILAIAAVFAVLTANADANKAVIRGKTSVLPDSAEMVLFKIIGNAGSGIARAHVSGGQFAFEVPVDTGLTRLSLMSWAPGLPSLDRDLFVRPGAVIDIECDNYYVSLWPVKSNVPEQAEYDSIINANRELWERQIQADLDDSAEGEDKSQALYIEIKKGEIRYLSGRALSAVELDYLADIARVMEYCGNAYRDNLLALYQSLSPDAQQSRSGQAVYDYLFPARQVGVGDQVPDLPMYDLDGNEHHFSELLGKLVLVDLWSAGCGPCVQAIPELKEVDEKYGGVVTVSLSLDLDPMWRQASEKYGVAGNNWNEGLDYRGLYQRVNAEGMPTYVVIAPDGTIADTWCGYGPGAILSRMDFFLNIERGETMRSEADGVVTVENPACGRNNTYTLVIDRVELSDKATVLHFNFYTVPNTWIKIAPEARLVGPDGAVCKIIGSEGILPGQELFANDEGRGSFSILFEPFEAEPDVFDFREDYNPDGWSIVNIRTH